MMPRATSGRDSSAPSNASLRSWNKRTGVSAVTVSRAIRKPEMVSEDVRRRIDAAVRELGYVPNYLASALDDIADYIFASAKKINFYKVNPNDQGIQKMADLIDQGCEQIKNAVLQLRDMRDMRQITDALVKVNSIENQADDIFDMSIDRLFETEPDAKEVIKKREIYQVMEIVTDKCEDAGNVIESIIIKYA